MRNKEPKSEGWVEIKLYTNKPEEIIKAIHSVEGARIDSFKVQAIKKK